MNRFLHFNLIRYVALAGALGASVGLAHATSIAYNLTGVKTSAGSLTGTVTIDTASDLVTAANITFNNTAAGNPVFNIISSQNSDSYHKLGQDYISGSSNSPLNWGGQITLFFDTANIGTGDLNLCIYGGPCGTIPDQTYDFTSVQVSLSGSPYYESLNILSGSLDPEVTVGPAGLAPAVTPEPASLMLLGTGILGLAVLAIRRQRVD
jgi:hypothetical protein